MNQARYANLVAAFVALATVGVVFSGQATAPKQSCSGPAIPGTVFPSRGTLRLSNGTQTITVPCHKFESQLVVDEPWVFSRPINYDVRNRFIVDLGDQTAALLSMARTGCTASLALPDARRPVTLNFDNVSIHDVRLSVFPRGDGGHARLAELVLVPGFGATITDSSGTAAIWR